MSRKRKAGGRTPAPQPAVKSERQAPSALSRPRLTITPWTWGFGAAGLLAALAGFFFLGQGSMTLAPILLVAGCLVFFPIALTK
jgi:hypothetical protein